MGDYLGFLLGLGLLAAGDITHFDYIIHKLPLRISALNNGSGTGIFIHRGKCCLAGFFRVFWLIGDCLGPLLSFFMIYKYF